MVSATEISRVSEAIIKELVANTGKSEIEIIEEALESYRFHERMKKLKDQYVVLQSNEENWKQELAERKELEGTLLDGLADARRKKEDRIQKGI